MTRSSNASRPLTAVVVASLGLALTMALSPASGSEPRPAEWGAADAPVGPTTGDAATPKSEVSVAIDPTDPDRMLASAIDYDRTPGPVCCGWRAWFGLSINTSSDGGHTWVDHGDTLLVGNDGQELQCGGRVGVDPSVTFDVNGVGYVAYLSYSLDDSFGLDPTRYCPDWTLAVQRSTDHGQTWSAPVVVDQAAPDGDCPPDRDTFAAHPSQGIVYLAWSRLCSSTQTYISSSTDGGQTWTAPAKVSERDQDDYGVSPAVTPDGTIYIGYYHSSEFDGCPAAADLLFGRKLVSKQAAVAISRDGGATWTHRDLGQICDNQAQMVDQPFWGGSDFSWPALAADPDSGLVGITWSHRDQPSSSVHVVVSRDGGLTWAEQISLATGALGAQLMPEIAAAGGMLRVTYVRMISSGHYDVEYRESADGVTWSDPIVLNTERSCQCWGGLNGPGIGYGSIGDYIGLDARAGRIVTAWPDNRDHTKPQNIFARVATY